MDGNFGLSGKEASDVPGLDDLAGLI